MWCNLLKSIMTWKFFLFLVGWGWVSWYSGQYWPILPAPGDRWWWLWRNWWNKDWQGKPKYSEKTYPSATLSTANPTWLVPGLNPSREAECYVCAVVSSDLLQPRHLVSCFVYSPLQTHLQSEGTARTKPRHLQKSHLSAFTFLIKRVALSASL
jgi:hypothetical protein